MTNWFCHYHTSGMCPATRYRRFFNCPANRNRCALDMGYWDIFDKVMTWPQHLYLIYLFRRPRDFIVSLNSRPTDFFETRYGGLGSHYAGLEKGYIGPRKPKPIPCPIDNE